MDELIFRLAVALAIGLVVGVERGWRERTEPPGSRTAGVRTYTLCGLLGGVSAALAQALESPAVFIAASLGFAGVFAGFKYREMVKDNDFGITGIIAAMLVFALGALAVAGDPAAAGAAAIAATGLLAAREMLHGLLAKLTWVELRSALVLLGMTVIVLPLLPDRTLDPFDSINLRQIWLFMVLTATISFAGYVAVRVAGPEKGILISALAGALVSSTAVTIAFARRAAAGEPTTLLAGGAALAAMVSLLRVLAICMVVAPSLLTTLAPPALAAALAFAIAGGLLVRHAGDAEGEASLGNPFELGPLAAFAGMFGFVSAVSGILLKYVGPGSLYLVSAVAGIVDVDVPSLNAARLAGNGLSLHGAALAILIAMGMNALGRVGFAAAAGPAGFTLRLGSATAAAAGAALVVLLIVQGW
ncbi:MgtC/SapB family protein [Xanthobacter autotrophicus]|uniref:MgtC/SapB family protein n=1 Tax=Xanthobacter autotrophicus TaxID=280 RepID=UPI0037269A1F